MLIVEPRIAWDSIAMARKSFGHVLVFFLIPLIVLSIAAELAGMIYLGRNHGAEMVKLPISHTVIYGVSELVVNFGVVFIGAITVKSIAETFRGRHPFAQCFTVVAYALSPMFLLHVLDAFPMMNSNPWISFAIGIVLCMATLYYGIPRVLDPDPTNAFGLYFMSMLLLAGIAAVGRLLTYIVLNGGGLPKL